MKRHTNHHPPRSPNTHKRPQPNPSAKRTSSSARSGYRRAAGHPPLRCAPAVPPPPSSLPPSRGRHSPRGDAAGPGGRLSAVPCRAGAARRGEAHFHFLPGSFFTAPSRAEPRRLYLPRHSSPPAPRRRLPAMRSEAERCGAVPSCRAGRGRLSRHCPAPVPAGAARGRRGGPGQAPRTPAGTPPNPSRIPLPPFAALTCRARSSHGPAGHAAKGCCFFGV